MKDLPLIIAVDFDGTLFENAYPDIGKPRTEVITYCKMQKLGGAKLILWTCREGKLLDEATYACFSHGLTFDAINDNLPELIEKYGSNSRKVFANEYIDDHNSVMFPAK